MGVTMFMVTPLSMAWRSSSRKLRQRRSAVVVDQDIGCRTGLEQCRLAFGGGDVGEHRRHGNVPGLADFRGGLLEQRLIASVDDERHPGFGQRWAQPLPRP